MLCGCQPYEERNRLHMFEMIHLEDGSSQRRHLEQVWLRTDIATEETDGHTTEQCKQTEFKKPLSM